MTTKPQTQSPHVSARVSSISFTMINSPILITDSDNYRSGNSGQNHYEGTTIASNTDIYWIFTALKSGNSRRTLCYNITCTVRTLPCIKAIVYADKPNYHYILPAINPEFKGLLQVIYYICNHE